jgi:hypothetical protein
MMQAFDTVTTDELVALPPDDLWRHSLEEIHR